MQCFLNTPETFLKMLKMKLVNFKESAEGLRLKRALHSTPRLIRINCNRTNISALCAAVLINSAAAGGRKLSTERLKECLSCINQPASHLLCVLALFNSPLEDVECQVKSRPVFVQTHRRCEQRLKRFEAVKFLFFLSLAKRSRSTSTNPRPQPHVRGFNWKYYRASASFFWFREKYFAHPGKTLAEQHSSFCGLFCFCLR